VIAPVQAILQNRKSEVGSVSRVFGPDIETIVIEAARQAIADRETNKAPSSTAAIASPDSDRDLIARHVARIVLRPRAVEIALSDKRDDRDDASQIAAGGEQQSIRVPWSPPVARRRKGILHRPASHDLDPRDREALLTAIAKARSWMDDLIDGRARSFEEIAEREQKVARHIRFLAPLAFLSPRIIDAIANGDVPAGATVSGLVRSLPHNWAEQEQLFGLR
jgi:site-specific DNA recombinase